MMTFDFYIGISLDIINKRLLIVGFNPDKEKCEQTVSRLTDPKADPEFKNHESFAFKAFNFKGGHEVMGKEIQKWLISNGVVRSEATPLIRELAKTLLTIFNNF